MKMVRSLLLDIRECWNIEGFDGTSPGPGTGGITIEDAGFG